MSECAGGQTYHQYEPRYSTGPTTYPVFKEKIGDMFVVENRDGHYKNYIYDICIRCGKTVRPHEYSEDKKNG